jgi:hypothetical protein
MAERFPVEEVVKMVGVAQSAERIPVEDEVAGSFPVAHPIKQVLSTNQGSRLKKLGSFDFKITFGFRQSEEYVRIGS